MKVTTDADDGDCDDSQSEAEIDPLTATVPNVKALR